MTFNILLYGPLLQSQKGEHMAAWQFGIQKDVNGTVGEEERLKR